MSISSPALSTRRLIDAITRAPEHQPCTTTPLEPLEPRVLLSATLINFQPANASVPSGYLVDAGDSYGNRGNGQTYGWVGADNYRTRDRNSANAPDQRHDTLNHFENGGVRTWELAVANGQYDVAVTAGDPNFTNQVNSLLLEGTTLNDPDGQDHFDTYNATVVVNDGKLTLTQANGGSNAKINFIEVTPTGGPQALTAGYVHQDIGPVSTTGGASHSGGTFTLTGSGSLSGQYSQDAFQYAWTEADGDFTYIARVASMTNPNNGAKAGVMVRTGLDPDASSVFLGVEPSFRAYTIVRQFDTGIRAEVKLNQFEIASPLWLKADRHDDMLTLSVSEDGIAWSHVTGQRLPGLPTNDTLVGLAVASRTTSGTVTASFDNVSLASLDPPAHQTTWFGNTYAGGNIPFPEAAYTATVIPETGETLITGSLERDDWIVLNDAGEVIWEHGLASGRAGVGNANHYFLGLGYEVSTDARRAYDGFARIDPNGENQVHRLAGKAVHGMAIFGNRLYVADATDHVIRTYDTTSMNEVASAWSRDGVVAMTADNNGDLWIALEPTTPGGNYLIKHYSPSGADLNHNINKTVIPRGMAVNPSTNELWVTDLSEHQRIRKFSPTGSFTGYYGGYRGNVGTAYNTDPGQVHPLKFDHPVGIGFDSDGDIVVATNGAPGHWNRYSTGTGLTVTKLDDATNAVQWQRFGLEFVDVGDVDPATDGTTIYTKNNVYSFDRTQPVGQQWTQIASTVDPFAYPDDLRLGTGSPESNPQKWDRVGGAQVARVDGQRVLYVHKMTGTGIAWYRFEADSEIAIPAGFMDADIDWDADGDDEWVFWQDADGDGRRDAGEVQIFNTDPGAHGFKVGDDGTLWLASDDDGVRRFETTLVNSIPTLPSSPINNPDGPRPAPFQSDRFRRIFHDPTTDIAIVSGNTAEHPNVSGVNSVADAGNVLARYENWTEQNGARTLTHQRPFDVALMQAPGPHTQNPDSISDIAVAGGYVFAVKNPSTEEVQVYRQTDLALIDRIHPGPEIGGLVGLNDLSHGINAHQLNNGQIMLLVEDDLGQKGIVIYYDPPTQQSFGMDVTIGRSADTVIQAEDYDLGGASVAYTDTTTGNAGGQYRSDDVDISVSNDLGGGFNVGWTSSGEKLRYTVNTEAGDYRVRARVASASGSGSLRLRLDGEVLGTLNVPSTSSGWQDWVDTSWLNLTLPERELVELEIEILTNGFNLNHLTFEAI
jgi:hypothetical protein